MPNSNINNEERIVTGQMSHQKKCEFVHLWWFYSDGQPNSTTTAQTDPTHHHNNTDGTGKKIKIKNLIYIYIYFS